MNSLFQKPVTPPLAPKCPICQGRGLIKTAGVKFSSGYDMTLREWFILTRPCSFCPDGERDKTFRQTWLREFPEDFKPSEVLL